MTDVAKLDTTRLNEILRNLGPKAEEATRKAAFLIEGQAKVRTPLLTGALRNSIKAEPVDDQTWRISDAVTYGIWQEFGTSRMAAHPFMFPAVISVEGHLPSLYAELFE